MYISFAAVLVLITLSNANDLDELVKKINFK